MIITDQSNNMENGKKKTVNCNQYPQAQCWLIFVFIRYLLLLKYLTGLESILERKKNFVLAKEPKC